MNNYDALMATFGAFMIVFLLIYIAIYVAKAIFLGNLHKKIYGEGNILVWIPYASSYMLGKLAFNKAAGLVVLIANIISSVSGSSLLSTINLIIVIVSFVFAIMKYNKLKSGELSAEQAKVECESTSFSDLPFFKSSNSQNQTTTPTNAETSNVDQTEVLDQNNESQQATNFCTNCGAKVEAGTVFCPSCGQKLN